MKAVLQIVNSASLHTNGKVDVEINFGCVVLVGVEDADDARDVKQLASDLVTARVFNDENGKINLNMLSASAEVLVVSNFTLCADMTRGKRPSFTASAGKEKAESFYLQLCSEILRLGVPVVKHGYFGADMKINCQLSGPVTILFDTKK